jgi:hypothetical protein
VLLCYLVAASFQHYLSYHDLTRSGVDRHHPHREPNETEPSRGVSEKRHSLRTAALFESKTATTKTNAIPPPLQKWKHHATTGVSLMPLDELTMSSVRSCPPGMVYIGNVVPATSPSSSVDSGSEGLGEEGRWRRGDDGAGKVPRILHQTAKSRCVTPAVATAIDRWRSLTNWSYYFYDDDAVTRLFRQEERRGRKQLWTWQQQHEDGVNGTAADGGGVGYLSGMLMPLLDAVAKACASHSGTIRADLFRYLVLYRYGGVYADIDSVPAPAFTPPEPYLFYSRQDTAGNVSHSCTRSDCAAETQPIDSLFVVEQYHLLSQYFMAASPEHPILWYAIQYGILNLLRSDDTGKTSAALATGPHALHQAFMSFVADGPIGGGRRRRIDPALPGNRPVRAGTYLGTGNRSVTVLGTAEDHREIVDRDVLRGTKRAEYARMAMRHFQDDKKRPTGRSCLSLLLELASRNLG